MVRAWSDSNWSCDSDSRRLCSGGQLEFEGNTVVHWSNRPSNVGLPSVEAELTQLLSKAAQKEEGCQSCTHRHVRWLPIFGDLY